MKTFFLFLVIVSSCSSRSQNIESILANFEKKNADSVIRQCSFPFDLSAGSMLDDSQIIESAILRKKLQQLFKEKYFDNFFKGKRTYDNAKIKVSYKVKTFSKNGELESESTLSFFFKKGNNGNFKLYKIVLAG